MSQLKSFHKKFAVCFMLSVLLASTVLLLGTDTGKWINPSIIFLIAALLFATPYIILPVWEHRERKKLLQFNVYTALQNIIAYVTGFDIMIFGWKKLFGLQFRTPLSIADLPMSSQSGETLTWFYFSHSTTFGNLIGLLQIAGSFLLFFRGTKLAAIFLLMPVMLNIMLINIFYQLNVGALLQSIVLTASLVCLLFQYRKQLMAFFFKKDKALLKQRSMPWIIAFTFSLIAFVFIFFSSNNMPKESALFGAYQVQQFFVNGNKSTANLNDSVLTKIYFDMNNVCVFEYNNANRRMISNYTYDAVNKIVNSHFKVDTASKLFHVKVDRLASQQTALSGSLGNDSVRIILAKLR